MKWYEDLIYIKMCEKAEEIQKDGLEYGDYWISGLAIKFKDYKNFIKLVSCKGITIGCLHIWLPRQDQLQTMYREYCYSSKLPSLPSDWWYISNRFHDFLHEGDYYINFNSMEQLWLAFVMKELYKKIWNGKNWIKGVK